METVTLMAIASHLPTTHVIMDRQKAAWSLSRRTYILSLEKNLTSIQIASKSVIPLLRALQISQQACPRDLPLSGSLMPPSTDLDGKYVSPEMSLKLQQSFQI